MMPAMEAVRIESRGRLLDSAFFPNKKAAEQYKWMVRTWAARRGLTVTIWTQKPAEPAPLSDPPLADLLR